MKRQTPEEIGKAAEASFNDGLYCAESVVLALARAQGVDSEHLTKMATGFCGGMSRTRGTCGAVTGGVMGIGLALGRSGREGSVDAAYKATQRFIGGFEKAFGSRECHVLLGCDLGTPQGQLEFRVRGLREHCARYTGKAAEMAAAILEETPD